MKTVRSGKAFWAASALGSTMISGHAIAQDAQPAPPPPPAPVWSLPPGDREPAPDPNVQGPRGQGLDSPRVIRPGGEQPARTTQPSVRQPAPTPAPPPSAPVQSAPSSTQPAPAERQPQPQVTTPPSSVDVEDRTPQTGAPSGEPVAPSLTPTLPVPERTDRIDPAEIPVRPTPGVENDGAGPWGWLGLLLGLIAALAGGYWLWRRRNRSDGEAEVGTSVEPAEESAAAPDPAYIPPAARDPAPSEPEAVRMQIDFQPGGAQFSPAGLTLAYRLLFANVSDEPLTDVAVHLALRSAAPDPAIGMHRNEDPEVILTTLAAKGSAYHDGELKLPAEAFRPMLSNGKKMIVPVVDMFPSYRDAAGRLRQIRVSMLIGRESDPPGGKMAPFWLDNPFRRIDRVGCRALDIPGDRQAA